MTSTPLRSGAFHYATKEKMIPDLALEQMTVPEKLALMERIWDNLSPTTIDIYAVLDCRQDPATIESRLRAPRTNR